MLLLDGVYVDGSSGPRFRWVKAPTSIELTKLSHTIAHRVSRLLERQGLLVRDDEAAYLSMDADDDDPMQSLIGHSITYRIATGPRQGRKVLTLQTLPATDEPFTTRVGNVAGFSRQLLLRCSTSCFHAVACMPAWQPKPMNAARSNACVAISLVPQYLKNACH